MQHFLGSWLPTTHIRRPAEMYLSSLTALSPRFPLKETSTYKGIDFIPTHGCEDACGEQDCEAQHGAIHRHSPIPHCPGLAQETTHKPLKVKREVLTSPAKKGETFTFLFLVF